MTELSTQSNRAAAKYSRREQALRLLWMLGSVIFRLSPRPCFAFRSWWLRLFGADIGHNVNIYPSARIYFPWNLQIGSWSAIGEWALIYNLGKISIGEHATISQNAHLCAGTHDYSDPAMPLLKPPITIGSSVWICADAFVGPGVAVSDGAVVGARSVVVKDVPAWMVVAGNPAKFVKPRVMPERKK
jgi:putative colanic acid biosynthesis acetyltransferase WcaF